jgi:hypothetical protein
VVLSAELMKEIKMDLFRKIKKALKRIIPKNIWEFLSRLKCQLYIIWDIPFLVLNIKHEGPPRQVYFPEVRKVVGFFSRHISGPKEIKASENELVVLCKVQNGQYIIASFIEHYFALGAKHIVFLDNESIDNTVSIARQHKNVTVLQCKLPFKTYVEGFLNFLLDQFGKNCWCLCADIDEFFDYPFSDIISLKEFLSYLNKNSYQAVVAQMLDMFSGKPLSQADKGCFSRGTYGFYDIADIVKTPLCTIKGEPLSDDIMAYRGGIRKRIFDLSEALMTKVPLVFLDDQFTSDNFGVHLINKKVLVADISCVLFHYKFTANLKKQCVDALKERKYFMNSLEYKQYDKVLKDEPDINIKEHAANPVEFKKIKELVDNNFLKVSKEYLKFVEGTAGQ